MNVDTPTNYNQYTRIGEKGRDFLFHIIGSAGDFGLLGIERTVALG